MNSHCARSDDLVTSLRISFGMTKVHVDRRSAIIDEQVIVQCWSSGSQWDIGRFNVSWWLDPLIAAGCHQSDRSTRIAQRFVGFDLADVWRRGCGWSRYSWLTDRRGFRECGTNARFYRSLRHRKGYRTITVIEKTPFWLEGKLFLGCFPMRDRWWRFDRSTSYRTAWFHHGDVRYRWCIGSAFCISSASAGWWLGMIGRRRWTNTIDSFQLRRHINHFFWSMTIMLSDVQWHDFLKRQMWRGMLDDAVTWSSWLIMTLVLLTRILRLLDTIFLHGIRRRGRWCNSTVGTFRTSMIRQGWSLAIIGWFDSVVAVIGRTVVIGHLDGARSIDCCFLTRKRQGVKRVWQGCGTVSACRKKEEGESGWQAQQLVCGIK